MFTLLIAFLMMILFLYLCCFFMCLIYSGFLLLGMEALVTPLCIQPDICSISSYSLGFGSAAQAL
jgi:hypothetical protein